MIKSGLKSNFWLMAAAAMAAIYFVTIFCFSENFPLWDDYYALMDFVAVTKTSHSFFQKTAALFEQHYEHRIAIARIITWFWYSIFGKIDFKGLVLVANLFYLGWVAVLAWLAHQQKYFAKYAVFIIACFAFSINQWEVSSWATAALFFYPADFFSLMAIVFFFGNQKHNFWWAAIVALVASFTGANGMLVFPAIALAAMLRNEWKSKKWFIWCGLFVVIAVVYLWQYERPSHQPPIFATLKQQPLMALRYFLVITGNVFNLGKNVALTWGLCSLLMLIWVLYKRSWKKQPQLFALLLFFLFTLLITTAGRTAAGAGQAFTPRYISYSSLYSALLIILTLNGLPQMKWSWPVVLACIVVIFGWAGSYYTMLPQIRNNHRNFEYELSRVNQRKLSHFSYGSFSDNRLRAKNWLRYYDSLGIFSFSVVDEEKIMMAIRDDGFNQWPLVSARLRCDEFNWYVRANFQYPSSDSIHFVSLQLSDGKHHWFSLMKEMMPASGQKQQAFEVAILRQQWPATPAQLRFQVTNEVTRRSTVFSIDTVKRTERFEPLKDW